ncbi:MAG: hypothetical protein HYZ67_08815 [Chlamydiae bacterium]|nr:hypothetical protein [Chlamydiota bacterium]
MKKNFVFIFPFLVIEGVGVVVLSFFGDFRQPHYPVFFVLGAMLAMGGYGLACRFLTQNKLIPLWIGYTVAILFRIILIPMYPGDDIWRYIWEGKIQNFGYSPYLLSPGSHELEALRTFYWPFINHPDYSAIYPPLAELTFRICSGIAENPVLFTIADFGIICFLQNMLRFCGIPQHRLWWYAWNPLVIYSFSGGGHFDSLMIFFLLASL